MELEEMKTLWQQMSSEIEKQKKMNDNLVIRITRHDYKNKISKIVIPEAIGGIGCIAESIYILLNFQKLQNPYLVGCGIISVIILLMFPLLSLMGVSKIRRLNIGANNFRQSLLDYSKGKLQFVFIQKLSFYLGAILLLVILPVMGKLIGGLNYFTETRLWLLYAVCFPFFYFFARWVFKGYIKTASDAENILKELEEF